MNTGRVLFAVDDGVYVLKFVGDVRLEFGTRIDAFIDVVERDAGLKAVVVDLGETEHVDSTSLGLLAKLSEVCVHRLGNVPMLVCRDRGMLRFLHTMGFSDVFEIRDALTDAPDCTQELPALAHDEEGTRQSVLSAHRLLMSLNERNAREFRDLVQLLEQGGTG
jgi:anti-anti-sigma factor